MSTEETASQPGDAGSGPAEGTGEQPGERAESGYTHQPMQGDEHEVVHPDAAERDFDWRGWLLVVVLGLAFVVAPLAIYLVPPSSSSYFTVLIVFPLFPALLLAAVAVWATTRP